MQYTYISIHMLVRANETAKALILDLLVFLAHMRLKQDLHFKLETVFGKMIHFVAFVLSNCTMENAGSGYICYDNGGKHLWASP